MKFVSDRVLSLALVVLLAPAMVALAVWVFVDSGRPVLFVQQRAGRGGKPFRMLKFRTMVNDAVALGRTLELGDDPFGIVPDDPRITRSGRFMRRTSLDELPQLFNVLVTQMSLVGPRPDLVEQAAHYSESDKQRLAVLPGITGYSQVHGRDEIGWPERIRQDIWYIDHWTLRLDLRLLLQTVRQVFRDEPTPIEDRMNIERARSGD